MARARSNPAGALALGALMLLAACARDVELPPPPAPEEEQPVFLGAMSGVYSVSVDLVVGFEGPAETFPVRARLDGLLSLLELRSEDGAFDVVTGGALISPGVHAIAGPAPEPRPCEDEAVSSVDRYLFSGPAGPGGIEGAVLWRLERYGADACTCAAADSSLSSDRAVGDRGLLLPLGYRICPGSAPQPLVALRACSFDPALSGLYEGTRRIDGGADERATVALGFVDDFFYGIRYPEIRRVLLGTYDAVYGTSSGLEVASLPEDCVGRSAPGGMTLRQEGSELRAELELAAPGEPAEHLSLARPAGGAPASCSFADALAQELVVSARRVSIDGQKFLALTVSRAELPGVALLPSDALQVFAVLRPAGGETWIPPVLGEDLDDLRERLAPDDAATTSALVPLPDPAPGEQREYELLVIVQPYSFGAEPVVAAPACVVDRGS